MTNDSLGVIRENDVFCKDPEHARTLANCIAHGKAMWAPILHIRVLADENQFQREKRIIKTPFENPSDSGPFCCIFKWATVRILRTCKYTSIFVSQMKKIGYTIKQNLDDDEDRQNHEY